MEKEFYENDTDFVAKELIGKKITRILEYENTTYELGGIIVETEAYGHDDDSASHAYIGISNRNKIMFEKTGCAYIYLIYGKHYCFNVTARNEKKKAGAVLIRALYPEKGVDIMSKFRDTTELENLTSGPSKLAQALCINKDINGMDLTQNNTIWIEYGIKPDAIGCTSRIGISRAKEIPWRFVMLDKNQQNYLLNPYVSKRKDIIKIIED